MGGYCGRDCEGGHCRGECVRKNVVWIGLGGRMCGSCAN
jgi:hypothetical protein